MPIALESPSRIELSRNFYLPSFHEALRVSCFLDAKDEVNNWCVAQIVDHGIDSGLLKLSFEGWSQKYDIKIRKTSAKISPFRSHTFGYTGQPKNAFRDFKQNQAYNSMMEKKVKEVINSRFTNF